jgi:3-deoxy-D-manno-octulosonic-acid transferase
MAAVPLIRSLHEEFADASLLVTTTTPTGADVIARVLGDAVRHVYFPYDLPWVLERFFARFRPLLLIVIETELWPNAFALCRARGVPIVLANARLSARSLRAYRRVPPLSHALVRAIDHIAAQTAQDAERFVRMGADPARVAVIGSLKFDLDLPASVREEAEALRHLLGVNRPLFMAASTRAGEEPIVLEAFTLLKARMEHLLLVLAPRHPERFDDVAQLCADAGHTVLRRSGRGLCDAAIDVYLVDTMGELPRFYAAADVAFVGGSLLPFGGHNVLEPASLGTPVLVGPHTYNFSEIVRLLQEAGALRVVADAGALAEAAYAWLADSNERDRIGGIGRELVRLHRGATHRTLGVVRGLLDRGRTPRVATAAPGARPERSRGARGER